MAIYSFILFLSKVVVSDGESLKQLEPGKRGWRSAQLLECSFIMPSSSAKMQPTDQMSIGCEYESPRITSGALYHLVTTCFVKSFYFIIRGLLSRVDFFIIGG